MPLRRDYVRKSTFFQIHKNGSAVDGISYDSLREASAALENAAQGGEVTAVDGFDRIVRRYTSEECRAALNSRNNA